MSFTMVVSHSIFNTNSYHVVVDILAGVKYCSHIQFRHKAETAAQALHQSCVMTQAHCMFCLTSKVAIKDNFQHV